MEIKRNLVVFIFGPYLVRYIQTRNLYFILKAMGTNEGFLLGNKRMPQPNFYFRISPSLQIKRSDEWRKGLRGEG